MIRVSTFLFFFVYNISVNKKEKSMGGISMYIINYYFTQSSEVCPSWMKGEHYDNCENFIRLFSFFKRKYLK